VEAAVSLRQYHQTCKAEKCPYLPHRPHDSHIRNTEWWCQNLWEKFYQGVGRPIPLPHSFWAETCMTCLHT